MSASRSALSLLFMGVMAAALAFQEKAVAALLLAVAVLVEGTLLRVDFVDVAGAFQLFQLAVDGGQANGLSFPAQLLRQLQGADWLRPPLGQAAQHCLLLFCGIRHSGLLSYNMKMKIIFTL